MRTCCIIGLFHFNVWSAWFVPFWTLECSFYVLVCWNKSSHHQTPEEPLFSGQEPISTGLPSYTRFANGIEATGGSLRMLGKPKLSGVRRFSSKFVISTKNRSLRPSEASHVTTYLSHLRRTQTFTIS